MKNKGGNDNCIINGITHEITDDGGMVCTQQKIHTNLQVTIKDQS